MYTIVWANTLHNPTNTLVDACAKESPWLCPLSRSTHNNLLTTHRARNHRAISPQWAPLLLKHWSQASSPAKPLTCYQTRICRKICVGHAEIYFIGWTNTIHSWTNTESESSLLKPWSRSCTPRRLWPAVILSPSQDTSLSDFQVILKVLHEWRHKYWCVRPTNP